jgi:hypothetical protein
MADETEKPDNLVNFVKAKERIDGGAPFVRKPCSYKQGACKHQGGFDVDPDQHEVECSTCGKLVDPFKAILIVANEWDWRSSHEQKRQLQAELERLQADVEKLKALRSKLKGEVTIPGKHVRKKLRELTKELEKCAAYRTGRGDKTGAEAYARAAFLVRGEGEHMVDGLLKEEGLADG